MFQWLGVSYAVEDNHFGDLLPVRYVLHGSDGSRFGLIPAQEGSHYFAVCSTFQPHLPTPFDGVRFTLVEGQPVPIR